MALFVGSGKVGLSTSPLYKSPPSTSLYSLLRNLLQTTVTHFLSCDQLWFVVFPPDGAAGRTTAERGQHCEVGRQGGVHITRIMDILGVRPTKHPLWSTF